jgi:hypothetical protein
LRAVCFFVRGFVFLALEALPLAFIGRAALFAGAFFLVALAALASLPFLAVFFAAFLGVAFFATFRAADFTVRVAREITRVAVFLAARPAAAVFSAAPVTAATAAVPVDFAVDTAELATFPAVLAASCAVSVTLRAALPIALPTASAVRVSASSPPAVSSRSSDIDAPFAPYAPAQPVRRSFKWNDGVLLNLTVKSPPAAVMRKACRAY